jgi:hypothetical protein
MRNIVYAAAAAALLATGTGIAGAREIEIDEVTITADGARDGRAGAVPWSGIWWPFTDLELAKGWNGTSADFEYNATSKVWERKQAQKPLADLSPLLKYDEYVKATTGTNPGAALLECTGDEAEDFEHTVYGDKKAEYDKEGISYSWWGHCNGWCGAALMEQEPIAPVEARGVKFDVADLKGLLSESYWGVESDFTGKRYNKPKQYIIDSREPGKLLLAALNTQQPKPVAEYIAWYEKAWNTTMTASARSAAKPADFKDELETFDRWYTDNYDNAFKDLAPNVFHRILETVIGRKKLALVFDVTANEEVWNHPAFAYESRITFKRSFTEGSASLKEWDVNTTVTYATDGVSESILGVSDFTKSYTYTLVTDATTNKVLRGEWTGSSVDNHPDFAWLPTYNPTAVDYGENFKLLYGKLLEVLPLSHKSTDARAIDLKANGTSASSRRTGNVTTSWSNPVAASGDVALSVAVASGRSVAKVKYLHQTVSGSTQITASRNALVALGESTTSPAFGATARFTSNGKKFVVAYAYDAAGKLVGVDEIALQYSTSTGTSTSTSTSTGADDAFEPNDSKAEAKDIAAGTVSNLQCQDDDWFKVTVGANGAITFKIDFVHSEGDLDMTLEGPTGTQLAKSDSTANQETCAASGLAAGTYYARIYGYNGAKAKYAATVTVQGGTGTSTSTGTGTDDSYEENDTRAAAKDLAAGSFPGLKCEDDDWFKVTLSGTGTITVKIDFRNSEGDLDLVLQDASGTQLAISESTADNETFTKPSLAAGTYYVRVFGYNGAKAAYALTLTTSASQTTTRTGTITASVLNVRSGAGTTYPIVTTVSQGTVVTILSETSYWYKVTWTGAPAGSLYVSKSYVRLN